MYNALLKLLSSYLFVVIVVFLMTIPFIKSEHKPYFINFNPKNIFVELEKDITNYINKKIDVKVIKDRGSIIIPLLLSKMKSDKAHKNEYMELYNELEFDFFTIPENQQYNLDLYIKELTKIEKKYNNKHLNQKLENYLLSKNNNIKEIEEVGTLILPNLMDFLKRKDNVKFEKLKPLYLLLNKEITNNKYSEKDLKAWFNSFVLDKRDYLKKLSIMQRTKMLFTETMFFEWIVKSFTFNFGISKDKSIYEILKITTIKTFLIFVFSIIASYFFILLFIFNKKLNSSFLNKNVKLVNIFPTIIIIIFLSLISRYFINSENSNFIYFYIFSTFVMIISILNSEIDIIYKNILKSKKIFLLNLYGLNDKYIFKKYILKKLNIESINKIVKLIPLTLFYIIIMEYIYNFHGVGYIFITSLKNGNYELLRGSILALGIVLIITKLIMLLILNFKYSLVKK